MIKQCFGLLVLAGLVISSANGRQQDTWKIASLNWQPYSGAKLINQGNSIQKLRELLRKEGIRLIVEFYPWKRAQVKARGKDFVGYYPAWPEEVKEGFFASPAIDMSEIGILKHSKSDIDFDSIDNLFEKYHVGVVKTYSYPKIIDDAMKKYPDHVHGAISEVGLLKKLAAGRHPVAITDPNVMLYLAENSGNSNTELVKVVMEKELVIAFRAGEDNVKRLKLLKRLLDETYVDRN